MSESTQQLRKICTTHTQTQDWTIHFDWCSQDVILLFMAKLTKTVQTYPSITLAAEYPKPKEVHYKIKLQRSNATTSTSNFFVPPPWQPPTVIDHHKTTHGQVFWRLHLSFNFCYFWKTVLFTSFLVYTKKSLQTTLSFFCIDLEDLSGTYLKITTNIYVVFKGYFEGPLVRFFGFCSNPLSRLGLHFCNVYVYVFLAFAWTMWWLGLGRVTLQLQNLDPTVLPKYKPRY